MEKIKKVHMPGFQSINSLLNKNQPVKADDEDPQEKFRKKMVEISEKDIEKEAMKLAASSGFPHIDLERFPVSQEALKQISKETAEQKKVICFFFDNNQFRLGAVDPGIPEVEEIKKEIEEKTSAKGNIYVISEESLKRVMLLYQNLPVIKPVTKDVEIKPEDLEKFGADLNDFGDLQKALQTKATTDILVFVLAAAFKMSASDIHVEAEEKKIAIRFRLDGVLYDAAEIAKDLYLKLVSRIKLISSLKINVSDKPQDGRFSIKSKNNEVDVRVSTIPTIYGESIVMRLLNKKNQGIALEELGVRGASFERLKKEIQRPNGMIITTGPTGSGKTTTLYSIMGLLNKPGVKIITLEDPVEYKMEGINQSQIDRSKDYTFAKGLRSMLRQDPDIAMVGEIRDLETADTGIQAALTGHLILSTLHTNSAAGAVPRFLSMGVKPFLLAPALNCVIGQRLVRKICENCKKEQPLEKETEEKVKNILSQLPEKDKQEVLSRKMVFYTGAGCPQCNNIGFKGRIGIYEIFVTVQEMEEMILTGQVSEFDIEKLAVNSGMITMVQDGLIKALDGITSVSEVFRVIE